LFLKFWHCRIREVAVACLNSTDYIHIRSALIFLTKVSGSSQYPTIAKDGLLIIEEVTALEIREKSRVDLQIMAKSLGAMLQRQSRDWLDEKGIKPMAPAKPGPGKVLESSATALLSKIQVSKAAKASKEIAPARPIAAGDGVPKESVRKPATVDKAKESPVFGKPTSVKSSISAAGKRKASESEPGLVIEGPKRPRSDSVDKPKERAPQPPKESQPSKEQHQQPQSREQQHADKVYVGDRVERDASINRSKRTREGDRISTDAPPHDELRRNAG
jgi:THO complex subunit 2